MSSSVGPVKTAVVLRAAELCITGLVVHTTLLGNRPLLLGGPLLQHSCKPQRRRGAAKPPHLRAHTHHPAAHAQLHQQQQHHQQQQQQQHQQADRRSAAAGPLRRLRRVCTCALRALPAASLQVALLSGVQRLSTATAFAGLSGTLVTNVALGLARTGLQRVQASRRSSRSSRGAGSSRTRCARARSSRAASAAASAGHASSSVTEGPAGSTAPAALESMPPAAPSPQPGSSAEVSVLTFNIRGVMDRWPERAPLLRQALKQADADVVCFQEVLTGAFGQEQQLLGSGYQVAGCPAALQNISSANVLGAAATSVVQSLLGVSWLRPVLVSLPENVESWRETHNLGSGWSRLLRDVAMMPFYGNSIASRLPLGCSSGSSSSTSSGVGTQPGGSSSSCTCWPGSWTGASASASSSRGVSGSSSSSSGSSLASDTLVLGDYRAAQRVCLPLQLTPAGKQGKGSSSSSSSSSSSCLHQAEQPSVARLWLVNTHLDHASPEIRAKQMQAICRWVEPLQQQQQQQRHHGSGGSGGGGCSSSACIGSGAAGIIITGDLNAPPGEALHRVVTQHGFASAHKAVHGSEPAFTWPTGIVAPLADVGEAHCADYVYTWAAPGYSIKVLDAQLCGDAPAGGDPSLYPSDHIGIKATLRITRLKE